VTASRPAPRRGSSWTPLESPPDLFAWPFDPSLVWFRLVDLLALATVVLWLGRRLRDRFLVIDVNLRLGDTVLAVAGLLRRADTSDPAVIPRGRRYGRWIAAVWAVAILGSLGAIKLVPVGEVSGASCAISGGSRQPRSGRHEGTRTACAVTQNRARLTDATVQGIEAGRCRSRSRCGGAVPSPGGCATARAGCSADRGSWRAW
jgi:hypothetical protein